MRMFVAALLSMFAAQSSLFAAGRWLRMNSEHFELLTDAGATNGAEVLRRFEQIRHIFETRIQRQNLAPIPVRVFVFRSEAEFREFRVNPNAAGYYQPGPDRDYIAMQAFGTDLYRVVFHEYVHLLMQHAGVSVPVWFNEGIAEVYSTAELTDHEIRIGDLIPAHVATLRTDRLLDIPTLMAVTHRSPTYNERDKTGIFYAESWALVHMLNFSPEYQPGMPNFAAMLLAGEDPVHSLQQAFGKSSVAVLADLTAYLKRNRFTGVRFPAARLNFPGRVSGEPVGDVDAKLALTQLLLAIRRPEQAGAMLSSIAADRPLSPELEYALGEVALERADDSAALEHFRNAVRLGSRSGRLRYDLAMILREHRAGDEEIVSDLREAVRLEPRLFEAHYLLGHMLLQRGSTDAIGHLQTASELAPDRSAVWEHLALAYRQSGDREKARIAAESARRAASTPEEADRAEATIRLVESDADSIVRGEPKPLRARSEALAEDGSVSKAEGLLTQVDCLGSRARLHVVTNGRKLFLLVQNPGSVVLRNAGASWTEFTCGPVTSRSVVVEYRQAANDTYRTSGEVAAIEFR